MLVHITKYGVWKMSNIVSMSNHLIRAGFSLTEWEMRIVSAAAAQIRMGQAITSDDWFTLSADTAIDLFDVDRKNVYRRLKEVADRLYERSISYKYSPDGRPHVEREGRYRWVQQVEYRKGEAEIAIKFSSSVIPYLIELEGQFTQYSISDMGKISSPHGQRLLQLLMQFRSTGYMTMSIDEMRFSMNVTDTHLQTQKFTANVIKVAATAIQKALPHIGLLWKTTKRGRTVTGYAFKFTQSRARDPLTVDFIEGKSDSEQKQIAPKIESPEQERRRKKQEVRDNIMDINDTNW